jgi:magnesium transporter
VEDFQDYLFIVIHFPVFNKRTRKTTSAELDIILFKNIIITSHKGSFYQLEKLFEDCSLHSYSRKYYLRKNAVYFLYQLLDNLIDARMPMLDHIADNIEDIEEQVFSDNEEKMLKEISIVKRDIINFRKAIKPQRTVLESLARITPRFTDESIAVYSQEVIGSNIKVWNNIENNKEMIEALEHTNESLLSHKLNETMQILTAFSVIMLPLTLIASIFGMNITLGMPFADSPLGFWIIMILMFVTVAISLVFFKLKKWL